MITSLKAEAWEKFLEVTGTRLEAFPLADPPLDLARALDTQAQRLSAHLPAARCGTLNQRTRLLPNELENASISSESIVTVGITIALLQFPDAQSRHDEIARLRQGAVRRAFLFLGAPRSRAFCLAPRSASERAFGYPSNNPSAFETTAA